MAFLQFKNPSSLIMDIFWYDYLECLSFDDGGVLLDEKMGCITTVIQDHVGLPFLTPSDTFLNAPPNKEKLIFVSLCSTFMFERNFL